MPVPILLAFSLGASLSLASVAAVAKEPWSVSEPAARQSAEGPHILLVYDMEGLAGQDDIHTAESMHPLYAKGRRLLTDDVNAVIDGLFAGGARAVSIVDGHGGGNLQDDILREEVDKRAQLILKTPLDGYRDLAKPGAFDGIAAVGMHAKSGSGGFFAHTWTLGIDIVINGRSMNETELLGMGYGAAGIPVIFVSGDDRLGQELKTMPWLEYVTVKEATGPSSAKLYPLAESREKLTAGAKRAVQSLGKSKVMQVAAPVEVSVRAFPPSDLSWIDGMPGVDYRDGAVHFTAADFQGAYRGITRVGTAAYQTYFNTMMMTAVKADKDAKEIENRAVQELLRVWHDNETTRAHEGQ